MKWVKINTNNPLPRTSDEITIPGSQKYVLLFEENGERSICFTYVPHHCDDAIAYCLASEIILEAEKQLGLPKI